MFQKQPHAFAMFFVVSLLVVLSHDMKLQPEPIRQLGIACQFASGKSSCFCGQQAFLLQFLSIVYSIQFFN